ncbi:MAG TPA: hypothetical protein VF943_02825 [Burkholderiales bacterium]
MAIGWFRTKEVEEFADSLVAELVERVPPSGSVTGRKAFDKLRRTFGATFERIDAFARSQPLNLYKKAHFANHMRWALKEAGYPPDFVKTMTQELVAHVTLESRRKKNA